MGVHLSEARKKYYAEHPGCHAGENHNWYGKKHSEDTKRKMAEARRKYYELNPEGREISSVRRKEYLLNHPDALRGENGPGWKGGISHPNHIARGLNEQDEWAKNILFRDDFTCQFCHRRGNGELNAHHIFFFAQYPELRMNQNNGITLCRPCHLMVHKGIGFD